MARFETPPSMGEVADFFNRYPRTDSIIELYSNEDDLDYFFNLLIFLAIKADSLATGKVLPGKFQWIKSISNIASSQEVWAPKIASYLDLASADHTTGPIGKVSSRFPQWVENPDSFWQQSTFSFPFDKTQSLYQQCRNFCHYVLEQKDHVVIQKIHYRFASVILYAIFARFRRKLYVGQVAVKEFLQDVGISADKAVDCRYILQGGRARTRFCHLLRSESKQLDIDQVMNFGYDYGPLFRLDIPDQIWDVPSTSNLRKFGNILKSVTEENIQCWSESSAARVTAAAILDRHKSLVWVETKVSGQKRQAEDHGQQCDITVKHKNPRTTAPDNTSQPASVRETTSLSQLHQQRPQPPEVVERNSLTAGQGFWRSHQNESGGVGGSVLGTLSTATSASKVRSETGISNSNAMPTPRTTGYGMMAHNEALRPQPLIPSSALSNWVGDIERTTIHPLVLTASALNWTGGLEEADVRPSVTTTTLAKRTEPLKG